MSRISLIKKLGVDTGLLKKATARYLEKVMLYHMNEQERNDLTGSPKPRIGMDPKDTDELPVELGDNLDDEPRDWLRDEYAAAFLASNLSKRSPEDQKKFHALFGNNYIKKLNYYYYEKGPRCLSRSPKYIRLNTYATNIAFRRLVPQISTYAEAEEGGQSGSKIAIFFPRSDCAIGCEAGGRQVQIW